eukprot:3384131-Amphidinium_carterae.1
MATVASAFLMCKCIAVPKPPTSGFKGPRPYGKIMNTGEKGSSGRDAFQLTGPGHVLLQLFKDFGILAGAGRG